MSEESKQNNPQDQQAPISWETKLQARANELVAQRIGPLKTEIERLQTAFNEMNTRLLEQAQTQPAEEETSGLLSYVKEWLSDSSAKAEQEFQTRLAKEKDEAEQAFQTRLAQAHAAWEAEIPSEEEFQKRIEVACNEAAVVARRDSQNQLDELSEQLEASRKALTLAVSSAQSASSQASSFEQLRLAVEEIDAQRTQSDTLGTLVRCATRFAPRVVFFVIKSGDAIGWKANGFENGLNDETAKRLNISSQNPSLLRDAVTTFQTAVIKSSSPGDNSAVLGLYGSPAPECAVAVPLVVRNKAAAVLYADSGTQSENAINRAALEILMRVASVGIELLPTRRGTEPTRPAAPPTQPVPAPAPKPVEPPLPEPKPIQEAATPAKPNANEEPAKPTEKVYVPATNPWPTSYPEPEPVKAASPSSAAASMQGLIFNPGRVTEEFPTPTVEERLRTLGEIAQPVVAAVEAPAKEEEKVTPKVEDARPTLVDPPENFVAEPVRAMPKPEVPSIPPPPPPPPISTPTNLKSGEMAAPELAPAPAPPSPRPSQSLSSAASVPTLASETEQRAHNDARRFARLLVSEIKLYNAAKVNEGRRHLDLYERLKDEVDRSRKVYDKRVSPAVATRFDYFFDELVQTLAEGDAGKLGPNCPGPVIRSS